MKIKMLAVISIATSATTPLAVIAHADNNSQNFASPSGNIRCILSGQDGPAPVAMCQIGHITYAVPPGLPRDEINGGPCPSGSDDGRDFMLEQGKPGFLRCDWSALGSGFGPWPTLDYGQTRSLGPITCDSEQSGMTCTDTSTRSLLPRIGGFLPARLMKCSVEAVGADTARRLLTGPMSGC
jgi:hypothetical protein